MFQKLPVFAAVLAGLIFPGAAAAARIEPPVQYVVISFDGAKHIEQWERSRALSRRTGAQFTYFLSCTYFLSWDTNGAYQGPRHRAGKSNVGFAPTRENVAQRLRQVWAARREGHEIASHGCGHFDGKDWSKDDWEAEFAEFFEIMRESWSINDIPFEPAGWRDFVGTEINGFRAPYLSTTETMFDALAATGHSYDASTVSRGPVEPGGASVMRFSLPMIEEGPENRRIIGMDYNLFVRHSGGLERPADAALFEQRSFDAFMRAFEAEYSGDRVPLQLGFHFTLMNGGAYWDALERFAGTVCGKPDVRCVNYRDLMEELRRGEETAAIPADG